MAQLWQVYEAPIVFPKSLQKIKAIYLFVAN